MPVRCFLMSAGTPGFEVDLSRSDLEEQMQLARVIQDVRDLGDISSRSYRLLGLADVFEDVFFGRSTVAKRLGREGR